MSNGTMSSVGQWNWADYTNSGWNRHTTTVAKGDVVFVFGQKVHGVWWAQLVLFAHPWQAPSWTSQNTWNWSTSTPMTTPTNGTSTPVPTSSATFSGNHT